MTSRGTLTKATESALKPLLRKEKFGGIAFHPQDGTHLELDEEGYGFFRSWIAGQRKKPDAEERVFLNELSAEMPTVPQNEEAWRLFELPDIDEEFQNALVLNSPTLVDLQVTTRCRMGCPHCYASSSPHGTLLDYEDAVNVLRQIADAGVCQLAIGGGEPLLHPKIAKILYQARSFGLVPNITTTGDGLSEEVLRALADTAGAVALSLEGVGPDFSITRKSGFAFFESALHKLQKSGIDTVFQVTLSAENFPRLPSIVDYCLSIPALYGVIFLAYKPAGRGKKYNKPLSSLPPETTYPALKDAFTRLAPHTRVGYDCCLTPGIVGLDHELGFSDKDLLEGCSAARSSVGITTDLDVVPCTFTPHLSLGNLRESTLLETWRGKKAYAFRDRLDKLHHEKKECQSCHALKSCLGGCPEWRLIKCIQKGPFTSKS